MPVATASSGLALAGAAVIPSASSLLRVCWPATRNSRLSEKCRKKVLLVTPLDRLGRTVRDTLNLIHELAERGVGVRNLADPIRVDSANPADPMAQLAVVLLALFGQMERTYTLERAAHARARVGLGRGAG